MRSQSTNAPRGSQAEWFQRSGRSIRVRLTSVVGAFAAWALVVMSLTVSGQTATAQAFRNDEIVPPQSAVAQLGLERAWVTQATLDPKRDRVSRISHDEDCIYILSNSGILTAIDAENGSRMWSHKLGKFDDPGQAAVSNEQIVVAVVGMQLTGIDKRTGRILWKLRAPGQASTSAAMDADQLFLGTLDGSVYALKLAKIRELYQERLLPQYSGTVISWRYQTGKEVTTQPLLSDTHVSFASRDGSVYTVSKGRRKIAFQFETDAPIMAMGKAAGNLLYVLSEDNHFYAIDARKGRTRWSFESGAPFRGGPSVIGDDVFVSVERGGMYSLGATTGERQWWQPRLTDFVGLLGNSVFARDAEMNLVMVQRDTGEIAGSLPLRYHTLQIPNDRTDRLYLISTSGAVMCLREIGRVLPSFYRYPERLPILPQFASENPADDEVPPAADGAETADESSMPAEDEAMEEDDEMISP